MDLPPDLANGLIITLLKNVRQDALPSGVSFVAATPKPRLVKIRISVAGTDPFSIAGSARKATHYVLKVDIGGIAGWIAPLIGKQPPDSHVWILEGEAPAFVRSQAPMSTERSVVADGSRQSRLATRKMKSGDEATQARDAVFWFDRKVSPLPPLAGAVTRRRRRGRRRHDGAHVCKDASGARPARLPRGGRNLRCGSERAFLRTHHARLRTRAPRSRAAIWDRGRTQAMGFRLGRRECDPSGGCGGPD